MASQYRDMGLSTQTLAGGVSIDWIQPFDISDWKDLAYQIDVLLNSQANDTDTKFKWQTAMSIDQYVVWSDVLAVTNISRTVGTTYSGDLGTGLTSIGLTGTALVPWKRFAKLVVVNTNASATTVTLHTAFLLKERTT